MGQKTHPIGFRLGVKVGERSVKDWDGRWFATGKEYSDLLLEDVRVRQHILTRMADAGVAKVEIERSANMITVTIHAAKPGIVIGKSGVKVEELRRTLEAMTGKRIRVTIQEIRQPETNAMLVARSIADQLEKRVAFRRAMKQAVQRAQRFGAKGVRVQVSGRLARHRPPTNPRPRRGGPWAWGGILRGGGFPPRGGFGGSPPPPPGGANPPSPRPPQLRRKPRPPPRGGPPHRRVRQPRRRR